MLKNTIDPGLRDYLAQEIMSKSELEQYFTAIQERFDNLEENNCKKFAAIDQRFKAADERFEKIESRLDNIETRLNRMESILLMILEIVKGNDVKWLELERRVFKLEQRAV